MNILFLSPEIPYPLIGGHHLRTYNIIRILAERHQLYLIAFAQHAREMQYAEEMKKYCQEVSLFPVAKTGFHLPFIRLALCNLCSAEPLIAQRYFIKSVAELIRTMIKQKNIHLLHLDMLALGLYRTCAEGIPVVLTDHNVEFLRLQRWAEVESNPCLKLFLRLQLAKLKRFEIDQCSSVDHCTFVSHSDLVVLGNLSESGHYSVIPNGVDTSYFYPLAIPADAGKLIWVGGMRGPHNADAVDYFLEAIWPRIEKAVPETTVDFIGEAPTSRLAKAAGQDPRLKVLGLVADIREAVQRATVFLAPIRSGSGTKIKVLNAMAQAKAVVATPMAVEGIEVTDGNHLFIAIDPDEFAQRVIQLLTDRPLAEQMGLNARKLIETKYSWPVIAREVHRLYDSYANS